MHRGNIKRFGAAEADEQVGGNTVSEVKAHAKALHRSSPVPVQRSNFSTPAERERAAILHRLCKWISAAVQRGEPITRAARRFSQKWNRNSLRSAPGKSLRLAYSTLLRHWYRWSTNPSREAFRLRYKPGGVVKVTPSVRDAFRSRCLAPGVISIKQAHRDFGSIAGYESFHRSLPRSERSTIRTIHRLRATERKALAKLHAA